MLTVIKKKSSSSSTDKVGFGAKHITRKKEGNFTVLKGPNSSREHNNPKYACVQNFKIKAKLLEVQRDISNYTHLQVYNYSQETSTPFSQKLIEQVDI